MSRKRRIFDIDMPPDETAEETPAPETFPAGKVLPESAPQSSPRRGPMAAAITENAGALRDRADTLAAIRAENDALAHEHVRLRRLGLVLELVPLDAIDTWKLVRDRHKGDDYDLRELVASIREVGLSNPIRVEPRDDGRFELIQGYRRLTAYRALLAETGDADTWGAIPAGIMPQGADLETLYRRMVDENMVRKDVSFAEMAQLAIEYAADPGTPQTEPDKAVAKLYSSASYQKRSYVRSFIRVMEALGETLRFAPDIPRALGLALATRLEQDPAVATAIRAALGGWRDRSVADEIEVLRRVLGEDGAGDAPGANPDAAPARGPDRKPTPARTTFDLAGPHGPASCTAGVGRVEIRTDRDFSTLDRRILETALRAFLDRLP